MATPSIPVQIRGTRGSVPPAGLAERQLSVELATRRLWVGVPPEINPAGRVQLNGDGDVAITDTDYQIRLTDDLVTVDWTGPGLQAPTVWTLPDAVPGRRVIISANPTPAAPLTISAGTGAIVIGSPTGTTTVAQVEATFGAFKSLFTAVGPGLWGFINWSPWNDVSYGGGQFAAGMVAPPPPGTAVGSYYDMNGGWSIPAGGGGATLPEIPNNTFVGNLSGATAIPGPVNAADMQAFLAPSQRLMTTGGPVFTTDRIINTNITIAGQSLQLPHAADMRGLALCFKDVGPAAGANPYNLQPTGGDLIDGQSGYVMGVDYGYVRLVPAADGTTPAQWFIE